MLNLENIELNDIELTAFMSNTEQIVRYVEEVSARLVNQMNGLEPSIDLNKYLSKSEGGEISANISISGDLSTTNNIIVGENNKIYGSYSSVFGESCQAGCLGFKVIGIDKSQNLISCTTETCEIPEQAIGTDITFLTTGSAKITKINSFEKINSTTTQIKLSEWDGIVERYNFTNVFLILLQFPDIGDRIAADYAHSEGLSNITIGSYGHSEGYLTMAGKYGHTEGKETYASWGAHAEGHGSNATNVASHAEGRWTKANGYMSHAEGWGTIADGHASHASGLKSHAKANDYASFVWQGYGDHDNYKTATTNDGFKDVDVYESHSPGTFNINPVNNIHGFYIGNMSLFDHIFMYNSISEKTIMIKLECSYNYENISSNSNLSARNDFYITSLELDDDSTFGIIDWGDGEKTIITESISEMIMHRYNKTNTYVIKISDDFKSIGLSKSQLDQTAKKEVLDSVLAAAQSPHKIISFKSNTEKLNKLIGNQAASATYPNMKEFIFLGKEIEDTYIFSQQKNLMYFYVPNVQKLPVQFIRDSSNFIHIHLPNVEELGTSAFYNSKLEYARFDNLKNINNTVFQKCSNLKILDLHKCPDLVTIASANSLTETNNVKISEELKIFLNKNNEDKFKSILKWKTVIDTYGSNVIFK